MSGDIVTVKLPRRVDRHFAARAYFGYVIYGRDDRDRWHLSAPVSGTIMEVNSILRHEPGLVNTLYKDGAWLMKLEVSDDLVGREVGNLLNTDEYKSHCENVAKRRRIEEMVRWTLIDGYAYWVYHFLWGMAPEHVTHIKIHASTIDIPDHDFRSLKQLKNVILNEELEKIGAWSFAFCISMVEIVIPNPVRVIRDGAFYNCRGLTRVTLGNGLEEIGMKAFGFCKSMEEIVIPPAVRDIHGTAFIGCTILTRVKFCDEIEQFVARWDWWNQGVGKKSLRTYSFLVRCRILARYAGLAKVICWQETINNMLRIIPDIVAVVDVDSEGSLSEEHDGRHLRIEEDDYEAINAHFDAIDAKLTMYEKLVNEVPTLFQDQLGLAECIVRTILSFL
jgi:glycine cleavage system H lipoate-binding protein